MPRAAVQLDVKGPSRPKAPTGLIPWLYLLFFLSGVSGLMYEVVWVRMLTRILGSTVYATSTVLAAFMAGLVLGSFLVGRWIDRARRPIAWYALLELGIGLSALASLALPDRLLPLYQAIYDFAGDSRAWLQFGQVVIALLVLVVPTALMGATLPTLAVHGARQRADFARYMGTLYGLNTLGALVGVLYSGFVLIGDMGETRTLQLGVLLNVAVAGAALLVGKRVGQRQGENTRWTAPDKPTNLPEQNLPSLYPAGLRRTLLVCFAVSGLVALSNEVLWSRMLVFHQGPAIYAFSAMLAVVLAGMGLGSFVGAKLVPRLTDPLRQLARVQLAVGLFQAIALHLFDRAATGWFMAPLVLLGPLGLLWGLAFPVGAACYSRSRTTAGRSIAELYAWNTLGCIAGALSAGFLLIPLLGVSRSIAGLAAASTFMGLALLWKHPQGFRRHTRWLEWGLAGVCGILLATAGDPYYRYIERQMRDVYPGGVVVYRHIEEAAATTTAFGSAGGAPREKDLMVNGIGMSNLAEVTTMMAHLPIALAENPHDVLVICFGMGTTARSASCHTGLQLYLVELVPGVLQCFGFFHPDGPRILEQPNVHTVVDDGRNYLLMHQRQYDVITIDPPPPLYSAGAVNLYSREFFQLCRDRLHPGGVLCLWIPPNERASEVKMIMRTYLDVFEHVRVWAGPRAQPGFLLIGSHQPVRDIAERIRRLYANPAVVADLRTWGSALDRPEKMLDLYMGEGAQLHSALADALIITDDCPYTEFPFWRSREPGGEYYTTLSAVPLGLRDEPGEPAKGPTNERRK
jgi:spermidine synthase